MKASEAEAGILVSAYGLMVQELVAEGVVRPDGTLDRKRARESLESEEAVRIFRFLRSWVMMRCEGRIGEPLRRFNAIVERELPDRDQFVNRYLISLYLLSCWVDEYADAFARSQIQGVLTRMIDRVGERLREAGNGETARDSYRIADNLYRAFSGKPLLDAETREAYFRMRFGKAVS